MKKVLIFSLIFISAFSLRNVSAQIHVDVPDKVEREANYRANKNADELIDKGFDEIENGIKGLFKKKNKKGKQKNSESKSTTANNANEHSADNNSNSAANSNNPRFQGLNRDAIEGLDNEMMKREVVYLTNHNGIVAGKGSVFVYKTSEGNYGKMEIIDIDKSDNYKTTFRYVTYANDGSILSQSDNFTVRGTYTCDLDNGTESGTDDNAVDFQVSREDDMNTRLDCYNDAAIALYKGNGQSEAKPKQHKVVWAKYDFVPGQTVIFEDGPDAEEENGEFPSRWDLYKGDAEIGEMDGQNVIMFLSGGTYIVPYLKNSKEDYLPDVFTIEFDVWFSKGSSTANRLWVYLGDQKNLNNSAAHTSLVVMPHSLEFGDSEKDYPGTENTGWTVEKEGSWKHISIAYTKGKYKAYFNDTRLINVPHLEVNPTGITIHAGNDNMYMKNFRVAKGGVKYYNRVMTDGKIVENGIRFDVNKATLKPESMGPINKIYKLMVKHPELKFSVEGHTDSDGDEAGNQTLSEARAKAVMDQLIAMGISADRLKSKGWGESKPIDTNATPEGKANNRRVEFVKF